MGREDARDLGTKRLAWKASGGGESVYQVQAVGEELSGDEKERSGRTGDVCVLQSAVEDGVSWPCSHSFPCVTGEVGTLW